MSTDERIWPSRECVAGNGMKNATLHGWPRIDRRDAARMSNLLSRSGMEDGWPENADAKFPNVRLQSVAGMHFLTHL